MRKKLPVLFTVLFWGFTTSHAQTPDWSSKVASIIYTNCSGCHHEGGIGPFSLMSYDEAVTNAFNIQSYVVARKMPPWPPDSSCSYPMIGDRSLSDDDINAIDDWVNGGMPSGDLVLAPPAPVFATVGSQLDGIDQTVSLPHYQVQLPGDEYRTFVIHSGYATAQYINQIEVIPGNQAIVHHVLVYYDPTSASYNEDMQDTLAGFSTNGANTPSASCVMIGGWAPGGIPTKLPSNMAYQVPANADFVVEVHYAPGSMGQLDSTKVNLKFCTVANPRLVMVEPVLFHYWPCINAPLDIPANTIKSFYEHSLQLLGDYSLLGVAPHCHLLGKSWSVYMTSPTNDTTRLVCIPDWDFHWQIGYGFHNLIHWNPGAGYKLGAKATYDNTTNNPNNPNNPPVEVQLGESTTDEMMVVFFNFLDYQPGDENIVLDPFTPVNDPANPAISVSLYPNPANETVDLSAVIPGGKVQVRLMNPLGATLKVFDEGIQPQGAYAVRLNVADLARGVYLLELTAGGMKATRKLVKVE